MSTLPIYERIFVILVFFLFLFNEWFIELLTLLLCGEIQIYFNEKSLTRYIYKLGQIRVKHIHINNTQKLKKKREEPKNTILVF